MVKESGWERIVKKRKRDEAAKAGARTLFDVGVKKKDTSNTHAPATPELAQSEFAPAPVSVQTTSVTVQAQSAAQTISASGSRSEAQSTSTLSLPTTSSSTDPLQLPTNSSPDPHIEGK